MAADGFERALARVLAHEGGYVNHPKDPGGATNRGVIQRTYDAWRRRHGKSTQSVRFLSEAECRAIYREQYWDAVRGDDLPAGIDYVVFDGAVNSGPVQSVKWLQRALSARYSGAVDGHVGQQTLEALAREPDQTGLVDRICDARLAFLKSLKTWRTFGKGWARRVADVRATGRAWTAGAADADGARYQPGGDAKALLADAAAAPSTAVPDALAGGSAVGTATVVAAAGEAKDALAPLAGSSATIDTLIAVLTLLGVALTIGAIAWRIWAKRRATQRANALGLGAAAT